MNRWEAGPSGGGDEGYIDYPSFDVASRTPSLDPPEVNYNRTGTELLSELHLFVIPQDTWKRQHKSPAEQIISDAKSAGYVRVNAQSTLNDMRGEISRQIGFQTIPRDFLFLRLIGRYFTQVSSKQENEVKAKYFLPPQAYSPELYLVDADAVSESQPTTRPTDALTHRVALPSIGASVRSPDHGRSASHNNYDDDFDDNDFDRRHHQPMSRADNDDEKDEIEQKKRLKMLEEEEELLRRKKMEEEERRRKKIAERVQTPSPPRRLTSSDRDAECMRIMAKVDQLKGRRQDVEKQRDRMVKQAKALQQNYYQKRHDARAVWKKRYFEEKKKTPPKEELFAELRHKLLECHRKELAHLELAKEAVKDSVKRGESNPRVVEKANATIHTTKLKNDIEDLSSLIQNTKMRLTSEMKLRNQSENELRLLKKDKALSLNHWKDDAMPTKRNASRHKQLDKHEPSAWPETQTYRSEKRAPQPIFAVLTEPPEIYRPIDHHNSHDDDDYDDDDDKKIRSHDLPLVIISPEKKTCQHCGCNRRPAKEHRHHRVKARNLLGEEEGDEGGKCRRCGGHRRRKHPTAGKPRGPRCPDCKKKRSTGDGGRGRRGHSNSSSSDSSSTDDVSRKPGRRGHHDDTSSDSDDSSSSSCDGCHDSSLERDPPVCGRCKRGGRQRGGKRDGRLKSRDRHGSKDDVIARGRRQDHTPMRNQKEGHDLDHHRNGWDQDDMNPRNGVDHHDQGRSRDRIDHKSDTRSTLNHDPKKDHDPRKDLDPKNDHDPKKDLHHGKDDQDRDSESERPAEIEAEKRPRKTTRATPKAPKKRSDLSKAKSEPVVYPRGRPYRPGDLDDAFRTFASKGEGKEATNADVVKWCTDAQIFGKNMTSQHVDISFSKVKPKGSKTITKRELPALIDQMAVKYKEDKKTDQSQAKRQISEKLANASFMLHNTTNVVKAGAVDRLTDTTKYTGMHKTRFDQTGKGKGKEGQMNFDGYVTNYKMAGTYDDRH